jgi:hypothetical protein
VSANPGLPLSLPPGPRRPPPEPIMSLVLAFRLFAALCVGLWLAIAGIVALALGWLS